MLKQKVFSGAKIKNFTLGEILLIISILKSDSDIIYLPQNEKEKKIEVLVKNIIKGNYALSHFINSMKHQATVNTNFDDLQITKLYDIYLQAKKSNLVLRQVLPEKLVHEFPGIFINPEIAKKFANKIHGDDISKNGFKERAPDSLLGILDDRQPSEEEKEIKTFENIEEILDNISWLTMDQLQQQYPDIVHGDHLEKWAKERADFIKKYQSFLDPTWIAETNIFSSIFNDNSNNNNNNNNKEMDNNSNNDINNNNNQNQPPELLDNESINNKEIDNMDIDPDDNQDNNKNDNEPDNESDAKMDIDTHDWDKFYETINNNNNNNNNNSLDNILSLDKSIQEQENNFAQSLFLDTSNIYPSIGPPFAFPKRHKDNHPLQIHRFEAKFKFMKNIEFSFTGFSRSITAIRNWKQLGGWTNNTKRSNEEMKSQTNAILWLGSTLKEKNKELHPLYFNDLENDIIHSPPKKRRKTGNEELNKGLNNKNKKNNNNNKKTKYIEYPISLDANGFPIRNINGFQIRREHWQQLQANKLDYKNQKLVQAMEKCIRNELNKEQSDNNWVLISKLFQSFIQKNKTIIHKRKSKKILNSISKEKDWLADLFINNPYNDSDINNDDVFIMNQCKNKNMNNNNNNNNNINNKNDEFKKRKYFDPQRDFNNRVVHSSNKNPIITSSTNILKTSSKNAELSKLLNLFTAKTEATVEETYRFLIGGKVPVSCPFFLYLFLLFFFVCSELV